MHTVNHIRSAFLDFFKQHGHEVVASAPLVPHHDPSLMFTNAGMVPFKNYFTGVEKPSYKRAASSQKCVRAGGKHNDLENVGYTARHHTFFEMLGNFSFGDYFKEDAISFSWEFLTKVMGLPKEKLLVTVYHTDDEAFDLWKKIAGLPEDKIIRIPTKDNFWAMGDTGPCGPCSEIFYDHGKTIAGGPPGSADEDGDRFVEIWNLVFMQYEMLESGEQVDLPAPSIDTGMGLERLATVLQGVHDNYDIDLFQSLLEASQTIVGKANDTNIVSHRVIADHLRSSAFLLADGVMPSNEGRGYVLRRIMRRAMRHVHQLGYKKPLMHQLVPALLTEMGSAYPELVRAESLISEMLKLEEERFQRTLGRGMKLLDEASASLKAGDQLPGDTAFKLYDTYGFPLDLTTDILRSKEISIDEAGFESEMNKQKERAKAAWKGSGEESDAAIWFDLYEQHGATEFLGYVKDNAQGKVLAIIKDQATTETAKQGDEVAILLNQTPFYGESGGQEGDRGNLNTADAELTVTDTKKKLGSLIIHNAKVTKGSLSVGDEVTATIDRQRRNRLRANHSATHILHSVLRRILGDHVTQKGSLVAEDRLRFDISQPKSIDRATLNQIEQEVNRIIIQNQEVGTKLMTPDDAIEAGALALFGEKYGDEVRVVSMGHEIDSDANFSVELCGGTHVERTGDIGLFRIISESAIAAGIRRIEALTGVFALEHTHSQEQILLDAAQALKVAPKDLVERIAALQKERKQLDKALKDTKKAAQLGGSGGAGETGGAQVETIGDVAFLGKTFVDLPPKEMRSLVNELQGQTKAGVVAVASSFEGKASLIVAVAKDLTNQFNAVELMKPALEALGAKGGGGKPEFAQTGGPNGGAIEEAVAAVRRQLD